MHGLINKAIEVFVAETYGGARWQKVMAQADLGVTQFEAMLPYPLDVTETVLEAAAVTLHRPAPHILEDLGTFLVTSPSFPAFRRLMRFGGTDYVDFLHSLEDMPDRVRLAIGDVHLPPLTLTDLGQSHFNLHCHPGLTGYDHVILGVLRAMADDYGALAILDLKPCKAGGGDITIQVVQDAYADGNAFVLGQVCE